MAKFGSTEEEFTVDFLNSHYREFCTAAMKEAMAEVYNIEMPIPKFAILSCVNKETFYKIMCEIRKQISNSTHEDEGFVCVLVVGMLDCLTCMIKHSRFFVDYAFNVRHLLIVAGCCLRQMRLKVCNNFGDGMNSTQIQILMNVLKNFLERVKDHKQFNDNGRLSKDIKLTIEKLELFKNFKIKKERKVKGEEENGHSSVNRASETPADNSMVLHLSSNNSSGDEFVNVQKTKKQQTCKKSAAVLEFNNNCNNFDKADKKKNVHFHNGNILLDVTGKVVNEKEYPGTSKIISEVTVINDNGNDKATKLNKSSDKCHVNSSVTLEIDKKSDVFAYMMACSKKMFKHK